MALRDDRLKWNRRYRDGEAGVRRPEPHPLALQWRHLWRGGAMLDAACGLGRGLASACGRFDPLYAVDLSEVAVARARELWRGTAGIRWIVGDVGALAWPTSRFGLVCAFGFTDLPFFRQIPRMLRSGGMFLYEGFAPRQKTVKPALNPDWIGEPEVLRAIFAEGEVLHCSESEEPPFRTRFAAVLP